MSNPSLRPHTSHVLRRLMLVGFALASAACENNAALATSPSPMTFTSVGTFTNFGSFNPGITGLTPVQRFDCSGAIFTTPIDLAVEARAQALTINSVSARMVDGFTLGNPSVTIPIPQLNAQFGSTVIAAGTFRHFALHPVFDCVVRPPTSVIASAILVDSRGVTQNLVVTVRIP